MILSDGTTTLTFNESWLNPDSPLSQSTTQSAGGRLKTQTEGERFEGEEITRMTGSEYRSLFDLLKNESTSYTYIPTETPPEYTSITFPISVTVSNIRKEVKAYSGDEIVYHVRMNIRGTELI